jgi:hypothetical protein
MAALLFIGLFAVSLGFQFHSGAWESDFGGHADEPAHVVTTLMVRDYLAGGFLEMPHPLRYAEEYYERFPKVAIGHYPPGFYVFAGAAMMPVRSGAVLLGLMNVLAAGAGLLVWWFGGRILRNEALAAVIAFLYVLLPQTRTYTAIVMADLLLVGFGLLAARSFVRFLESGRRRDSLLFGIWAAAAILTKGSGVGLALLPPVALALASKWRWFFKPALWLAPLPVLVLTVPWMVLTAGITSEGMQESGLSGWVAAALPFYGKAMVREVGWSGLCLLGAAAGLALIRGWRRSGRMRDEEAVLWALLTGGLAVPVLVPAGLDARYLMPVVPAILLLGADAVRGIAGGRNPLMATLPVLLVALLIACETWRPVRKFYTGASLSIEAILTDREGDFSGEPFRLLVVSDARGEGALIAAAALMARGRIEVARGTKLLSTSDWMGRDYRPAFGSQDEFRQILVSGRIRYLAIDPPPAETPLEHWKSGHAWLAPSAGTPFHRVAEVPSWRREEKSHFTIYRIAE